MDLNDKGTFLREVYADKAEDEAVIANDPIDPNHYNSLAIQPIEYITKNNIGYLEGNVIKYISRYKKKNGIEDLRKAQRYIELLIEQYEGN